MATESKKTTKKISNLLMLAGLSAAFTLNLPSLAEESGLSNTSPSSGADLSYEDAMRALEQTKRHSDQSQAWGERRTVEVPKGVDPQKVIEAETRKITPIDVIGVGQSSAQSQVQTQSQPQPQSAPQAQSTAVKEENDGLGFTDVDANQTESTKKVVEEPAQSEPAATTNQTPAATETTNATASTSAATPESSTPATPTRSASGIEYYNVAVKAHLAGKLDEAIQQYREALNVNPNLGQAHCNLGLIFNQQHKFAEALAEFQKALAIDPKDAITYNGIGAALRAQKDLDGAIKNWQTAVTYNPHLATAHYNLGTAYELKKDYDKALDSYRQATASDFRLGEAYFRMGIIMRDRNQKSEAKEQFNQALKVAPGAEYSKKAREFLAALEQSKN